MTLSCDGWPCPLSLATVATGMIPTDWAAQIGFIDMRAKRGGSEEGGGYQLSINSLPERQNT